jgi:hypothetical protein
VARVELTLIAEFGRGLKKCRPIEEERLPRDASRRPDRAELLERGPRAHAVVVVEIEREFFRPRVPPRGEVGLRFLLHVHGAQHRLIRGREIVVTERLQDRAEGDVRCQRAIGQHAHAGQRAARDPAFGFDLVGRRIG